MSWREVRNSSGVAARPASSTSPACRARSSSTTSGATASSIPTSASAPQPSGRPRRDGFRSARGAGCSASVGQLAGSRRFVCEPSGQGCAIGGLGQASIGVFTVVNSLGAIFSEDGRPLRGFLDRETGARRPLDAIIAEHPEEVGMIADSAGRNTTLTAVIVDKRIPAADLRQFGRQIHTSMAQVIRPFHTPFDGDILFSICTGEAPLGFHPAVAAEFAARLARQAIYSAVLT